MPLYLFIIATLLTTPILSANGPSTNPIYARQMQVPLRKFAFFLRGLDRHFFKNERVENLFSLNPDTHELVQKQTTPTPREEQTERARVLLEEFWRHFQDLWVAAGGTPFPLQMKIVPQAESDCVQIAVGKNQIFTFSFYFSRPFILSWRWGEIANVDFAGYPTYRLPSVNSGITMKTYLMRLRDAITMAFLEAPNPSTALELLQPNLMPTWPASDRLTKTERSHRPRNRTEVKVGHTDWHPLIEDLVDLTAVHQRWRLELESLFKMYERELNSVETDELAYTTLYWNRSDLPPDSLALREYLLTSIATSGMRQAYLHSLLVKEFNASKEKENWKNIEGALFDYLVQRLGESTSEFPNTRLGLIKLGSSLLTEHVLDAKLQFFSDFFIRQIGDSILENLDFPEWQGHRAEPTEQQAIARLELSALLQAINHIQWNHESRFQVPKSMRDTPLAFRPWSIKNKWPLLRSQHLEKFLKKLIWTDPHLMQERQSWVVGGNRDSEVQIGFGVANAPLAGDRTNAHITITMTRTLYDRLLAIQRKASLTIDKRQKQICENALSGDAAPPLRHPLDLFPAK